MAVTRGATVSNFTRTAVGTDASISHTVNSGTTLLVVSVFLRADITVTAGPTWNTTETMTIIDQTTSSGNGNDMHVYSYGLVNPTATTDTVSITVDSDNAAISVAVNYIGTETASVAAATNFLAEDVNDGGTSSSVFSSAGSAGNCLYLAGDAFGQDMSPASNTASFTELFDAATGPSSSQDIAGYVADLLNNAPQAVTINWSVTDENAAHYIEIVAAAGGIIPQIMYHRKNNFEAS